jgi:hypothetical protein
MSWQVKSDAKSSVSNISVRDETMHYNSHRNRSCFPTERIFQSQFALLASKHHFQDRRKSKLHFQWYVSRYNQEARNFRSTIYFVMYTYTVESGQLSQYSDVLWIGRSKLYSQKGKVFSFL